MEKSIDSSLIYAGRQLEMKNSLPEITSYCLYFRGMAFKQKRLFSESKSAFSKIPSNYIFSPKVQVHLGDIALEQKNYKEALRFYSKLKHNTERQKQEIDESKIAHNIGLCYLHLGDYENSEEYLFKALKKQKNSKDTASCIISYMDIAGLYYEQYKDHLAIRYYEKAYSLSKNIKENYLIKKNASLNMSVIEENRKNYAHALQYRKESEIWNDSLNNQNRIWAVVQLEKTHAIKDKNNEIKALILQTKLNAEAQKNMFYITLLLLVILIGGSYFYVQKLRSNKIIEQQKSSLKESNDAKDMLFSIISHDLRSYVNTLKNCYTRIKVNVKKSDFTTLQNELILGSNTADSTQNLLNNLLHWAQIQTDQLYFNTEEVYISSITEQVAYNYKALMAEKKISFRNDIQDHLRVKADQESLKIIIRNLLDNAIKYSNEGGKISIYISSLSKNKYEFTIEDTGKGISKELQKEIMSYSSVILKEKQKVFRGLGLHLCQTLIQKNSGDFKLESMENKGTKITISLIPSS